MNIIWTIVGVLIVGWLVIGAIVTMSGHDGRAHQRYKPPDQD